MDAGGADRPQSGAGAPPPAEPRDLAVVFGTVQRVMRAERRAHAAGLDVDVIPAPRAVSSECGVVLEARTADAEALSGMLSSAGLPPQSAYRRQDDVWLPARLDALQHVQAISLTAGSAYGGCGAKLSKGLLSTLLCGLPKLSSDDLLVGIESADDAGVLRVSPDLAIIHTVDFFPPLVDDPFAFGRIAAANALSDVYAMGGRPLAGMNLVSFPSQGFERTVLQQILRGGLDALAEAGAVLAGGHTIEGAELLYGLAVTGAVHPDRVWRNGGARPGDLLVLTKPLGTGVVTTAAKAGLAPAEALGAALRWMATLNRKASEAAARYAPHAVTDVTGFGLVGHAAELAEASGLSVELRLTDLPALPHALQLAGMGLVPAGTAKNRESTAAMLDVEHGADPLRVDLALDPQTSGGLLIACAPQAAVELQRQVPGAAIVGRCVEGAAGRVRLLR